MADAPKAAKKEEKPAGGGLPSHGESLVQFGIVIAVLLILLRLYNSFFSNGGAGFLNSSFVRGILEVYDRFKGLSVIISIALGFAIAYLIRHIDAIRTEERKALYPEPAKEDAADPVNYKWQRVIDHLESENSSDLKLAIIEADIILGDMLDSMGYHGDTIGDKLKSIEKSDFLSIDKAWEAHKIRNAIAHEGSDFSITRKEAFRVIELYKTVFEEFYFI